MRTRPLVAVVGFVAASFVLPAAAQSTGGAYIGAGLGLSRAQHGCTSIAIAGATCDETDSAWKIFGGYQANRNFSVEAGATDLGQSKARAAGASATIAGTALELSALGALPITDQLSIFGRFGGYRSKVKLSGAATGTKTSGNATFGLGIQYDFNRNLGLRGEWQRYQNVKARNEATGAEGSANIVLVGASLVWKF